MAKFAVNAKYNRRRALNLFNLAMSILTTAFGLVILVAILWTLITHGIGALSPKLFTEMTPPPGADGGLLNAIFGSVFITVLATFIGTPIGVMAGTFLAEYGDGSKLASLTRFINDILLSAPSILIGMFVYEIAVVPTHHFSAWAGSIALAIIAIPVVIRTTEDMLRLVPAGLREAAIALGTPRWKVVMRICYRAAGAGMLTGVLLSIARMSGETAPLLFTALNNQFWSSNPNAPMSNLPVVIFQFAMSPYEQWQNLAWAGAFLITITILALSITARMLVGGRKEAR